MTVPGENERGRRSRPAGDQDEEFVRGLSEEEKQLVLLRDELYGGDWGEMEQDLLDRKHGKPFIFKLVTRIEEDLERIRRLRVYEAENGVNLGSLVERTMIEEMAQRNKEGRSGGSTPLSGAR